MIRLAIFDLDGVLADSARLHFLAWKAIADELGIPFDAAANEELKGIDRMGSLRAILSLGGRTLPDEEMVSLAARKNAAFVDAAATMTPADMLPGVTALLDAIDARGITAAVASASRNAPLVLARLGIADRFAFVADPARAAPKPAPDLFLACADALGAAPAACVGFEDSLAGIAAIKAAGMRAVGVGEALPGADVLVASLAEVDVEAVFG